MSRVSLVPPISLATRRLASCLAALAVLGLAACADAPAPAVPAPIGWTDLSPFRLDVARIDIVDAVRAPAGPGNVETRFSEPPAAGARRWASERLRAVGASGTARFTIVEASVIELPLATSGGLTGAFTREQAVRYDARLSVRLSIEDAARQRQGEASATVTASQTEAEYASEAERQALWAGLENTLIERLNAELERALPQRLGPFLEP